MKQETSSSAIENFNEKMRDRTLRMAVGIHGVFVGKKITLMDRPMITQIIRSSSSVAANFRAACRARSDAEFYAKICIVAEECDETQFWLEYLSRVNIVDTAECLKIRQEVDEQVRIFSSMKKKMRQKLEIKSGMGKQ